MPEEIESSGYHSFVVGLTGAAFLCVGLKNEDLFALLDELFEVFVVFFDCFGFGGDEGMLGWDGVIHGEDPFCFCAFIFNLGCGGSMECGLAYIGCDL